MEQQEHPVELANDIKKDVMESMMPQSGQPKSILKKNRVRINVPVQSESSENNVHNPINTKQINPNPSHGHKHHHKGTSSEIISENIKYDIMGIKISQTTIYFTVSLVLVGIVYFMYKKMKSADNPLLGHPANFPMLRMNPAMNQLYNQQHNQSQQPYIPEKK